MLQETDARPRMLPRTVRRETPLLREDGVCAAIVYPGRDAAYRPLAEKVAYAIAQCYGEPLELIADTAILPARHSRLPNGFRRRPLILLGNLNTNRVLLPLYANYYCATDATYPGEEGYDLRTILNPYGTGENVILAGGSTLAGVERAVERLIEHITEAKERGEPALPFLLEVELTPHLAEMLAEWPGAPLDAPLPTRQKGKQKSLPHDVILSQVIGAYGILYAWTGDRRYGLVARDALLALNAEVDESYGDWHYRAERLLRVLPWLCAGGFLEGDDLLRTDTLLLNTALGTQDMWWRKRTADPPLGHRHHGLGTFEFFLLARYLRYQAAPNEAARQLCDRWLAESRTFLEALAQAGIDDQDDESTLDNLAMLFWYTLGDERFEFFESGMARRVAQRALALHDNMGAGAGQGGYGEALPGAMYLQQAATIPVAASAFYYQDGRLKWVLERVPHLSLPLRPGFLQLPTFMHKFDTGPELPSTSPEGLTGVQVLPVTPHQQRLCQDPPEHIEPMGHAVNAPETWLLPAGVGRTSLSQEQGFDKIVLRGGVSPKDPYLLLQGYQGGYRWQGHMQAANCIVRFSQEGHIFLLQNTSNPSMYHKNGIFISDGFNDTPLPPIAEWLAVADFPTLGMSITRLAPYHHTEWRRHIFWRKGEEGFFVIIDSVTPEEEGYYSATCTWRTLAHATLEGRTWRTFQGKHRFTLRCSDDLPATSGCEGVQGAAAPYVLRQRQWGRFSVGAPLTFQNLFYVRRCEAEEPLDLHRLDLYQALMSSRGMPIAWCGVGPGAEAVPGFSALHCCAAWSSQEEVALAGVTRLAFGTESEGWSLESDRPVGVFIDLIEGRLLIHPNGPGTHEATTHVTLAGRHIHHRVPPMGEVVLDLPNHLRQVMQQHMSQTLRHLATPKASDLVAEEAPPLGAPLSARWHLAATYDQKTSLPGRLRDFTVTASPPPENGFSEQLGDTVLPETRALWRQWPPATAYDITLTFREERDLDHLRIIGDSLLDPTLNTFRPLPPAIEVHLSSDGFHKDLRQCTAAATAGTLDYKRYRDLQDRMEVLQMPIGQKAREVRLRVPAPSDGGPLVLHEIEVYGGKPVSPSVRHLQVADLDGDGEAEVVLINDISDLIVLGNNGRERWQRRIDAAVTHLSCHDLLGDGRRWICLGTEGGHLQILSPEGTLRQSLSLSQEFQGRRDVCFGWLNAIHAVGVWHREPDRRAALAVGGYSIVAFLDPEGSILGHSWVDGSWVRDLLPVPSASGKGQDLWARVPWNHGICIYEGEEGMAPSGAMIDFGGMKQPMFRRLRRVIPFVTGKTVAFQQLGEDQVLLAAETGVGILSIREAAWCWKIEGGTPITACAVDGDHEVIIGGADGFVTAFNGKDGRPQRSLCLGDPVVGLAFLPHVEILAVATQRKLLALDKEWRTVGHWSRPWRSLWPLGNSTVLAEREDGLLDILAWMP